MRKLDQQLVLCGVYTGTIGESHRKISVKVNGQEQTFHIDTGAEVTVITEACMKLSEVLDLQVRTCTARTRPTQVAGPRYVTSSTGTEGSADRAGSVCSPKFTKTVARTTCNRRTTTVVPCEECPEDYSIRDTLP